MKRYLLAVLALPTISSAQLIAYESFTGINAPSGLIGSGADASGWTDAGWVGGNDARFQVFDPTPDITFQIAGGPLLNGSNRAVQLSTNPEPVPGVGLVASRSIPPQNATFYISFLVRPTIIGSGSDSLDIRFNSGSTLLARLAIKPDQNQQYFYVDAPSDGSGSFQGSYPALFAGQTYLIVARVSRPNAGYIQLQVYVNPPAANNGNYSFISGRNISGNPLLNAIGLGISSADIGGPTSTAIFDDFRVGYTWADVVPPGPPPALAPAVTISNAVKLGWQTQSGKTYQPQYSYDMGAWFNLGPVISGNGQLKELFDATDADAKRFYRIQIK